MVMAFPKYESYKDSGVEWLGEIPEHWDLQSIRAVTELKSERNRPDLPVLSVYREYGVLLKDSRDDNHNATSLDISNYKAVGVGDLVINKMKAWQGSMGISEHNGIVSPAYITCRVNHEKIEPKFLHYLLRSKTYIGIYNALSYGVRVGQWDMHYEDFKKIPLPLPSVDEQKRIANFIDRITSDIDQAIAKKQRLIELLNEQKSILINRAVTKGLNPNVPMRDSGIDAIGEIPEHWKLVQNRRILKHLEQGSSPAIVNLIEDDNEEFYVLKLSAVKQGLYIDGETKKIPRKFFSPNYQIKKGDFLMTRGNTPDLVADICCVDIDISKNVMISDLIYRLIYHQTSMLHEFMTYFFRSASARNQIKLSARGSSHTMVKVSQEHIKSFWVLVPPLGEQEKIISYLKFKEKEFICLEASIYKEIEKLNELKSIFISEAVTGKIKV